MTIEVKRAALERERTELVEEIGVAMATKNTDHLKSLLPRLEAFKSAQTDHQRHEKAARNTPAWATAAADSGTEPTVTTKATGKQLSPLAFSDASLKAMYKAFKNRQPLSIAADTKAFSTVDSLLPARLNPNVVASPGTADSCPMIRNAFSTEWTGRPPQRAGNRH